MSYWLKLFFFCWFFFLILKSRYKIISVRKCAYALRLQRLQKSVNPPQVLSVLKKHMPSSLCLEERFSTWKASKRLSLACKGLRKDSSKCKLLFPLQQQIYEEIYPSTGKFNGTVNWKHGRVTDLWTGVTVP